MTHTRRLFLKSSLSAAALALAPRADAAEKVRMSLDWTFQGPQSIFTYAADKGYFSAEGIDITIDRGAGSADAVNRVGSGAYDIAIGDTNSMIEYNMKNTQSSKLIAVMMIYDRVPLCVISMNPAIKAPKDLEGKRIVTSQGAADYRLFPLFARGTGVDMLKVNFVNVQPQLRESMLVRGEVDGSTGFYHTSYLTLKAMNADLSKLKSFMYYDYGVKIYGNSIVTSRAFAEKKPEVVKGFNRAVARALRDLSAAPALAMTSLKKRDGTIDEQVETERLQLFLNLAVKTPFVQSNGFGDVDPGRMAVAIDQVSEALALPGKPASADVFTNQFLPPKSQRMLL